MGKDAASISERYKNGTVFWPGLGRLCGGLGRRRTSPMMAGRKSDPYWTEQFARAVTRPSPKPALDLKPVEPGANRAASWSLALGLVSIPLGIFLVGGLVGIAAIVLGIRSFYGNTNRRPFAAIGIGCGSLGVTVALVFLYWLATFDLELAA
jgi:hypothetical protein